MTFRALGDSGPYPAWLRALRDRSGVYAIREKGVLGVGARVVYVGESHRGRLYDTLTRHFQSWGRTKDRWRGMFRMSQQHDPGTVYDRAAHEVAVRCTPAGTRAIDLQRRLIARLAPADNLIDAPF